jgi:hypothetical protein
MQTKTQLSEHDIRSTLIKRAEAYAARAHTSFSAIGLAAVNDSKFLGRVQNGLGFNIKTYQKVMDWLDAAERESV